MKKKPKWWEKEWDSVFKERLSEMAMEGGKTYLTFNDYAKQQIQAIVDKELRILIEKHNLFAIAKNKEIDYPHEDKTEIDRLVRHFRAKEERMKAVQKSLHTLKELLK